MATEWKTLAKNHIPGRDWGTIKNIWGAAAIGLDPSQLIDLSEQLDPILTPDFSSRDNVSVFDFPGRHVASFQDASAALLKCSYLLRAVGNCIASGQPTWGAVDAYHFSFIAARTLLAFLGISFVHVADSYCVIDVFPEGLSDKERRDFARLNPGKSHPARLIFRSRSSPIEQRSIWTILLRAIRVSRLSTAIEGDLGKIAQLGEGFGTTRNELLYRNTSWIYNEDLSKPSRDVTINDDINSYQDLVEFFLKQRDANFAFAAIFARILSRLATEVLESSGVDILRTSYGECLKRFTGFKLSNIEAVYEQLYRKDGYSIDLESGS